MKAKSSLHSFLAISAAALPMMVAPTMLAADHYWNTTTTGTWATAANWSDDPTSGGTTGIVPTSTDSAFFNQSSVIGATTVLLDADAAVAGIAFANTGTTTLRSDSTTVRLLTIDAGGITINSDAGAATLGNATNVLNISLDDAQSWTNNATSLLTVVGNVDNGSHLLTISGAGNTTINGVLGGGSGGLTKSGAGRLILTSINTLSGLTTISGGIVDVRGSIVDGSPVWGTGDITISQGANLFLNPTAQARQNTVGHSVSGAITLGGGTGTSTIRFGGNDNKFDLSGGITGQAGTAQTLALIQGGILTNGDRQNIVVSGPIADGSGGTLGVSVDFSNSSSIGQRGYVNLTGQNTFTGDLTITNSRGLNGTGTHPGAWVTIGGERYDSFNVGSAAIVGTGFLGTGADYSGNISVSNGSGGLTTLSFLTSANQVLRGVISGTGSLHQQGSGTLTLTNTNTYTGATTIRAGVLEVSSLANAGVASGIGAYAGTDRDGLILSGGTFRYIGTGNATTNRGFTVTAASAINISQPNVQLTLGDFRSASQNMTVSGAAGSSLVIDRNTLTTGSNSQIIANIPVRVNEVLYDVSASGFAPNFSPGAGSSTVTVGTVTTNLPSGNANVVFGGAGGGIIDTAVTIGTGQFRISTGASWTFTGNTFAAGNISLNAGTFRVGGSGTLGTGGVFAGNINHEAAGRTFDYASSANQSLSGNITGAGNFILSGSGTLTLTGTGNTYTGTTTISAGTLQLGNGSTTGALTGTSAITNDSNITINRSNAFSQATDLNNRVIAGTGSLTQAGAGTTTLSLANTYTGATNVNNGTLLINGSTSTSSAVTVATGGTLGGTGTVGGAVTVNSGGTIAPGTSIGSFATGALTLAGGAVFSYEVDSGAAPGVAGDLLAVSGNLTLDLSDTSILTLTDLGSGTWILGDKLTLISYTGTWNGGLFTYNSETLENEATFSFAGMDWFFKYDDEKPGTGEPLAGTSYMTMTAVPEPGTALLGSLGLLVLLRRRRS